MVLHERIRKGKGRRLTRIFYSLQRHQNGRLENFGRRADGSVHSNVRTTGSQSHGSRTFLKTKELLDTYQREVINSDREILAARRVLRELHEDWKEGRLSVWPTLEVIEAKIRAELVNP